MYSLFIGEGVLSFDRCYYMLKESRCVKIPNLTCYKFEISHNLTTFDLKLPTSLSRYQ